MNKKIYLLFLAGINEMQITIIDKETWDWIFSPFPGDGKDPNIPASQIALCKKEDKEWDGISLTSGSYDNDRALGCQSVPPYKTYFSLKDAFEALKKNNDKIVDEWHFCIY